MKHVEKKKREINNVFTEAKYAEDDAKWVADYGRSVAQWLMRSRKAAPPLLSAIMEKKVQQRRTDGSFPRPVGRAPSGKSWDEAQGKWVKATASGIVCSRPKGGVNGKMRVVSCHLVPRRGKPP